MPNVEKCQDTEELVWGLWDGLLCSLDTRLQIILEPCCLLNVDLENDIPAVQWEFRFVLIDLRGFLPYRQSVVCSCCRLGCSTNQAKHLEFLLLQIMELSCCRHREGTFIPRPHHETSENILPQGDWWVDPGRSSLMQTVTDAGERAKHAERAPPIAKMHGGLPHSTRFYCPCECCG